MKRHSRGCRAHLEHRSVTQLAAKIESLIAPNRREKLPKAPFVLALSVALLTGCSTYEPIVDKQIYFSHSDVKPFDAPPAKAVNKVFEPISVYFANDSYELIPSEQTRLSQFANQFETENWKPILISGHTDSNESDEYNLLLGQKRAEAVYSYLVAAGYPLQLIGSASYGELKPIANNDNAQGRQLNRRVEVHFTSK